MIYSIKNDVLEVSVNSLGAELNSIKKDGINRLYDKSDVWKKQSPILFPMIGTSKNNLYYYNNKEYCMNPHGFAFKEEFSLVEHSENVITFLLKDNKETFNIYPFKFSLYITYKICNNKLDVIWKVVNENDYIMYFNIGGHPGFNFNCNDNKTNKDYNLVFDDEIDYKVYGLNGPLITNLVDYNEVIKTIDQTTLINKHGTAIFKGVNNVSMVSNDKSIRIDTKTPYLAFWYPNPTFLCIEPWDGLPDYDNTTSNIEEKETIIKLENNNTYETGYEITLD